MREDLPSRGVHTWNILQSGCEFLRLLSVREGYRTLKRMGQAAIFRQLIAKRLSALWRRNLLGGIPKGERLWRLFFGQPFFSPGEKKCCRGFGASSPKVLRERETRSLAT